MKGFWELFKTSVIVQALITLVLLTTICYMYITTGDAPAELMQLMWAVLAFYFGSKVQNTISRR